MIGFNQENATYKGVGLSRNNLIANDIPFLNLATGDRSTSDYMNQWAIRGAFLPSVLRLRRQISGTGKWPLRRFFTFPER